MHLNLFCFWTFLEVLSKAHQTDGIIRWVFSYSLKDLDHKIYLFMNQSLLLPESNLLLKSEPAHMSHLFYFHVILYQLKITVHMSINRIMIAPCFLFVCDLDYNDFACVFDQLKRTGSYGSLVSESNV